MVFSGPFASEIASGTPRQAVFFGNSPRTLGVADDSSLTRGAAKIVRFFSTKNRMPQPFRLYRRRNDTYYLEDAATGKQTSLRTKSKSVATQRLTAHTQAAEQPCLNLTMAKAYLSAKSPEMLSRTWGEIMDDMAIGYKGSTRQRWAKVIASAPFRLLAPHPLLSTDSSHFFAVLRHPRAGVSTNVWLRILHNRALDMGWLLAPVLHKKVWPKIRYKPRRGITLEEHRKIVAAEHNPDYRLYYEVLWETGGSQTDIASLHRDQVDTRQGVKCLPFSINTRSGVASMPLVEISSARIVLRTSCLNLISLAILFVTRTQPELEPKIFPFWRLHVDAQIHGTEINNFSLLISTGAVIDHWVWRPARCAPSGGLAVGTKRSDDRIARPKHPSCTPDLPLSGVPSNGRLLWQAHGLWPCCQLRATLCPLPGPVGRPSPPKTWTHLKDVPVL